MRQYCKRSTTAKCVTLTMWGAEAWSQEQLYSCPFTYKFDVQCGHLVASIAISVLQNGHTFVVGAACSSSSFFLIANLAEKPFISLIIANSTAAIIKKLITAVMKLP